MIKSKKKDRKKFVKSTVIDDKLLIKAANDYFETNKIIRAETEINLASLHELSLSFKNILKIQYLSCLDRLEKLQLDNNLIEKIENLDHLVSIKWLDLSFNNIREVEGLDKLVNLTDLSLFNNQIVKLKGLDNCIKLNVLSIGNNKIETFDEVIQYLGKTPEHKCKLRYLQVLNVMGNPFTLRDKEEYEAHIIHHLPNIKYLNYIYIDDAQRQRVARSDDKFKIDDTYAYLRELRDDEEKEKSEKEQRRKKELAKMHLIDNMNDDLVLNDEDIKKLIKIKSVEEETSKFTQKLKEIVETIQKKIMEVNQKKLTEIRKFELAIEEREKAAERETIEAIKVFQHTLKVKLREIEYERQRSDKGEKRSTSWRVDIQNLLDETEALKNRLLAIEVQLLQDVETFFHNFEKNVLEDIYKEMERIISGASDEGGFKKIGEESKEYYTKLDKICKEEAERYNNQVQNNSNQNLTDEETELEELFENRDNLSAALTNIRDRLLEKNGRNENLLGDEINLKDKKNYTEKFRRRQFDRKSKNVNNISDTIQNYRSRLSSILKPEDNDD